MGSRSRGWGVGHPQRSQVGAFSDPRWSVILEWLEWIGTGIIFISVGIVLAGLADRAPPFKILSLSHPAGIPGERITFDARVWRDLGRDCSVTMYRSVFHSGGKRTDLVPQFYSAEFIRHMERMSPGVMRPEIEIPENATPGQDAYVSSTLRYVCNQYQHLLPIDVQTVMPFAVLPPK
jgi:hypothetical protein